MGALAKPALIGARFGQVRCETGVTALPRASDDPGRGRHSVGGIGAASEKTFDQGVHAGKLQELRRWRRDRAQAGWPDRLFFTGPPLV